MNESWFIAEVPRIQVDQLELLMDNFECVDEPWLQIVLKG